MVTHGYVIIKYKGIYYSYYNHSDSYCSQLGKIVFDNVNDMILNKTMEKYKSQILRMPFSSDEGECFQYFHSLYEWIYLSNDKYFTSNHPPYSEYTYIIDFDENEFIVTKYGKQYVFYLFDIPDDWIEIVETNDEYIYENKEEIKKEEIRRKIEELQSEIVKLQSQLNE
jgi:hypothetical protein